MVVDHVVGEGMDQNVEALAVEHQPRNDLLKRIRFEDRRELGDRVWADRRVVEAANFDREVGGEDLSQLRGDRERLRLVVNMRVVALNFRRSSRRGGHGLSSFTSWTLVR